MKRKGDGGGSSNQKATQAPCNPDKKQKVQAQESAGITHYMASFQVLASDVEHNSPSLLLNIDKFGKICFNAGEGLQRLVRESKVRLQKLDHYLFTRIHTSTLAGLPGMLLSTSTTGSDAGGLLKGQDVNVCLLAGPSGLGHYCDSFSSYINQEQTLKIIDLPQPQPHLPFRIIEQPVLECQYATIRAITVEGAPSQTTGEAIHWIPADSFTSCYVCDLAGLPGKFDPKKAEELKVPNGPLRGELQKGREITLPSLTPGDDTPRVVRPDQVMSASSPGPLAIIVDCPSLQFLDSLTGVSIPDGEPISGALDRWTEGEEFGGDRHRVMFHFSPPSVFSSKEYQSWLNDKLGKRWNHVLCASGGSQSVTMRRATALQAKLNCFDPNVFPLLHPPSESSSGHESIAPSCLKYHMLKQQGADLSEVDQGLSIASVQEQFAAVAGDVIETANQASKALPGTTSPNLPMPELLKSIGREELEIVFLGTVSAVPSKFRNVTSIYVDRFNLGGLLLDCGEDALGQLKRRYGGLEAERRLRDLRAIWISHMHADHHGGLYRLLQHRGELLMADAKASGQDSSVVAPILIIGPVHLFDVLSSYRDLLRMPFHFLPSHFIDGSGRGGRAPLNGIVHEMYKEAMEKLDLITLRPVPVEHVGHASGICIEGKAGWKVVFSGDTRPCASLVNAARDATLLIHEATFEDEMQEEARAKRHSTSGEAMAVGAESGAYRTVLTHFSSRYPSLPKAFDAAARPDVAIAMDFMSINLADLEWLPRTVGPLDALFKREEAGWQAEDA